MNLEPIQRLSRDLAAASATMTPDEARYLVDAYYTMQDYRIAVNGQCRALGDRAEPHSILLWLAENESTLENQIKRALDKYTDGHPLGRWAKSITGIGPVISAGLLAHIDIEKINNAHNIWSFAGLDPARTWNKGEKRPWNAKLKTLCWKIGESFVKVSGNENDFYGKWYRRRKDIEAHSNAQGLYAAQAAAKLDKFKIGKSTEAYKAYSIGQLPPAHIHARARRWAVKLFLSHYYEVGREIAGLPVVRPYAFNVLRHDETSFVPAPNWPMIEAKGKAA
jgi:hypothetical protein